MLLQEHSTIHLTFIKLPFVIKIFVLSIFEWPFYTGFTVFFFQMMNLIMNPTELQEACERGTFVSLITISGSMSNVSQDFEKLMCMDINTIYTALMNLSDSQSVQDKVLLYNL